MDKTWPLWTLALLFSGSCGSSVDCSEEPDRCLLEAIRAETTVEKVEELAGDIQDPLIRGLAVSEWVELHAGELTNEEALRLCEHLSGVDRGMCMRPYTTPHLRAQ
ncbi:MAG TPA: hypothetical protein QGF58_24570 [Myxococcota bacterium]|nr:hypothetical protein [Myxococcota bacterium]